MARVMTTGSPAGCVISKREAACTVDESHTSASPHGSEPITGFKHASVIKAAVAVHVESALASEIGVLDIAFKTDHERADLVAVVILISDGLPRRSHKAGSCSEGCTMAITSFVVSAWPGARRRGRFYRISPYA
jgi:hypothetical protein